jgi:hypothetical protein
MRTRAAATASCLVLLALGGFAPAARAEGSFESSDSLVDLIWRSSVRTAQEMVSPPTNLDRRGCQIDIPLILLDGVARDRCPYIGDQAVTGKTLLVSQDDVRVLREMLLWFASVQNADGSIPASPFRNHSLVLIDYNAYWIESLYDYVLWTGDLDLLRRVWPNLVRLVDELYPAHVSGGLLVNWLGPADYAYIPRGGSRVSYYNAQYVRALGLAASLAGWHADGTRADRWRSRAAETAAAFPAAFWNPAAGAFRDTAGDGEVHALDGNAFAILAGIATPAQAQSALAYVERNMWQSFGNSVADRSGWRGANWGDGDHGRVYPFVSFFELLARYAAGADESALELIRREWGFMAVRGPGTGTMWETIANEFGGQVDFNPSWSHGWSSGAAPALTAYVLGVQPTSPGFATFTVTPRPSGLRFARGVVPTPRGPIRVAWELRGDELSLQVTAPPGTVWENPPAQRTADQQETPAEQTAPAAASSPSVSAAAKALGRKLGPALEAAWRAAGGW